MWNQTRVEREAKPGEKLQVDLHYNGGKQITTTSATCGCSSIVKVGNSITVNIDVPTSYSITSKLITVNISYADGTWDKINIHINIKP